MTPTTNDALRWAGAGAYAHCADDRCDGRYIHLGSPYVEARAAKPPPPPPWLLSWRDAYLCQRRDRASDFFFGLLCFTMGLLRRGRQHKGRGFAAQWQHAPNRTWRAGTHETS